MTFVLIRHGETDWNARGLFQGSADIPLNETGLAQARAAGTELSGQPWDVIVCSPLQRAARTAEVIADAVGLPAPRRYPELTERDYRHLEGAAVAGYGPQDGPEFADCEPEADVTDRAAAALDRLAAEHRGRRVLVVAHGTLIRLVLSRILGEPVERIHNAAANVIEPEMGDDGAVTWAVRAINGQAVGGDRSGPGPREVPASVG